MSRGLILAGIGVLAVFPLAAQQDHGVIIGTVFDLSRAAVPGATVLAREVRTNVLTRAETNANGVYFLGPLKTGVYDVSVRADGFKESVRREIRVHPNDRIGLDFVLEVGSIVEVIEVAGATPMLGTESASLEHVVDRRSIEQLPLVDRNYQVLAKLAAGVLPEIGGRDRGPLLRGGALSSGFTSHGQPALQNNYLIDGVDNNTTLMGLQDRKAQAVVPSLEAIEEFKIQTSNYSAE
ncbi:MAG TPA: carboxypeptidase regulatory-like domain-containing protein, partial [Bryobacterales bacterium]|nr:carboxypeptidase regulatory-like domain-containing protein [Bryobacterales bacterium]